MNIGTIFRQWQSGSGLKLHKRQVITLAIVIVILLIVAGILGTYTIIRPTYPAGIDANAITVSTYDTATGKKTAIKRLSGSLLLVPRSAEALAFQSESQEESLLLAPAQLGTIGVANVEVKLKKPSTGTLVNVGSEDCVVMNGNKSYSYRCDFPVGFSLYAPNAPSLDKQAKSFEFTAKYTAGQYRDGILAWKSQANTKTTAEAEHIQYITPEKGIVNTITLPKDVNRTEYLQVITDRANPQNTAFVAYNYASGVGYYYPDVTSKNPPKVVKRKRSFDVETNTSSCVLSSTVFSCYHGRAGEETHDHDETGYVNEGRAGGSIERTDMGTEKPETRSYSNGGSEIDELLATASGIIYARGGTTLSRVDFRSAGFGLVAISSNSTIAAAGSLLYYVQDGKVYAYDESTDVATLAYSNDRQTISRLAVHGGRALSLGYNKRDPLQLVNVYDISSGETR